MTDDPAVSGHGTTDDVIHDTPDGAHHDPHAADDHHDEMGLGPIDWTAWAVGALGVGVGLATAVCFALSTGLLG